MRKRIGIALALIAVLVAAVAVPSGSAATKKSHNAASHVVARSLKGNTVTGTVKGKLGSGAVIYVLSGNPDGTEHLKVRAFYALGTITGKADVTITPTPAGGGTFTGQGTFTGGTAKYKGSTGKFTITGTIDPPPTQLINADLKGTVKF